MRILSWNVNGVKACVRHGDFEQIRKLEAVDVICLQEIRTQDRPIVLKGYHHYWYPAEQKRYSGTMTLSLVKPERVIYGIGAPELDTEGRVLTIEFGSLFVVNVYVPNSTGSPERREYRRRWDQAFLCFLKELSEEKDVIVCGDFNVTMSRKDIYAENERMDYAELGYVSDERSHLMSLMKEGFVDAFRYLYPEEAKAYTWWSNRLYKRNEGRGWRLDYFLVCESLKDKIQYVVHHQEIRGSDHCPIVLGCEAEDEQYGKKAMEALEKRASREDEEKRLTAGWKRREAYFPKYRESLKKIQAEITIAARMRDKEKVRKLQIELLENIRLKFLAVEKVVNMHAPRDPTM